MGIAAVRRCFQKRAKTDAIDAQTLAELGARLQPDPWTPPPAIYAELYQRLAQRDALVDLRTSSATNSMRSSSSQS